jgi:hypothetical protein
LLQDDDFDVFVTHLLWMRFVEYVPARFVSRENRACVLNWVRSQLKRSELNDDETVRELQWHAERIQARWSAPIEGELPF